MPVTATAIVTTVLLAMQGAALTFGQIRLGLEDALSYLESRWGPFGPRWRGRCPAPRRGRGDEAVGRCWCRAGRAARLARGRGAQPSGEIGPEHQLAATFSTELPDQLPAGHGAVRTGRAPRRGGRQNGLRRLPLLRRKGIFGGGGVLGLACWAARWLGRRAARWWAARGAYRPDLFGSPAGGTPIRWRLSGMRSADCGTC